MTVSSTVRKKTFLGNDLTTAFDFSFKVFADTDLQVVLTDSDGTDAELTLDSDYSVALNGDQEASPGGSITYPISGDPLATGEKLTVTGVLVVKQETNLANAGGFFPETLEDRLDYMTILIQEQAEKIARAVLASASDDDPVLSLGTATQRAGKFPAFDDNGDLELAESLPSGTLSPSSVEDNLTQAGIGRVFYPLTAAEADLGLSEADVDNRYPELTLERYGFVADNATEVTTAVQNAIDVAEQKGGGIVTWTVLGTALVDTLYLKSNVHLRGPGWASVFKLVPHTLTHNPVIRIGGPDTDRAATGSRSAVLGVGSITGAKVSDFAIDGNTAGEPGAPDVDEFSPCIMLWQSHRNIVERMSLSNAKGDGVTIGYDFPDVVGSDDNIVQHCYITDNDRQGVALTSGSGNKILYNRVSGAIGIEIDDNASLEAKDTLVHGNSGTLSSSSVTDYRVSDLAISTATLRTVPGQTSGTVISNNHCFKIEGQYNNSLQIIGNFIIGSRADQEHLLDMAGVNNLVVSGNTLIANASVATTLTHLLRTRAGTNVVVTDNVGDNGGLPFHSYTPTFGAEPSASGFVFRNNIFTGGGAYRNGTSLEPTEESVYKIETSGATPNVITLTHISGPVISGLTAEQSPLDSAQLRLDLNWGSAEGLWTVELLSHGETDANAEPYDETVVYGVNVQPPARDLTVFSAVLGTTLTYAQFSFADAATQGTLFARIRY